MVRQDRGLYEPPPPADIEKMRRNKILEQKAFALLREILSEYKDFFVFISVRVSSKGGLTYSPDQRTFDHGKHSASDTGNLKHTVCQIRQSSTLVPRTFSGSKNLTTVLNLCYHLLSRLKHALFIDISLCFVPILSKNFAYLCPSHPIILVSVCIYWTSLTLK